MSRRSRKSSPFEDAIDVISHLPWWGCLIIGVVAYFISHKVATAPQAAFTGQSGQIGSMLASTWVRGVASAAQFIVPIICLAAAAASAFKRRKRTNLIEQVSSAADRSTLDNMTWSEFEILVSEAYRRQGYQVVERGGSAPDGGIDLILRKDGAQYFVQCKQWKAFTVGVDVVRELKGVVSAHGARGGFVITSGQFTNDATEFARKANINLVDGVKLHAMIRGVRPPRVDSPIRDQEERAPVHSIAPSCPVCASLMVRREARRGSNAGSSFWGCPKYPACRGTRQMN